MRWFLRFAISFLVLCVVIFAFAYMFGPPSIRQSIRNPASPVGQLNTNDTLTPNGAVRADTTSGSTTGATSSK